MSRNRIIYQSEALFSSIAVTGDSDTAGAIPSGNVVNLQRVTEISNNAEITRQDVNVFGQLASISREVIEEPTVSMDFKYYLADGFNESGIGLTTFNSAGGEVTCLSGILANTVEAKRNFYVLTVEEGADANLQVPPSQILGKGVIGIGNAYLTNYTVDAAVGEIPSASVSVEAANITFNLYTASGIQNPAIDSLSNVAAQLTGMITIPTATTGELNVKVLRPGDIVMDFGSETLDMGGAYLPGMDGTTGASPTKQSAHIQSFSLELPLSRTPLNRLGNSFAFSRELDVPINITLNVSANLADISEGGLNDLICATQTRNITIKMYEPCSEGTAENLNLEFTLKGASLDSQNMSSTIGDSKTVELTFVSQVGGPQDTTKGLFISGKHGNA